VHTAFLTPGCVELCAGGPPSVNTT